MGTSAILLVGECGVPLSLVVTGANRHDVSQLQAVLDGVMVNRPNPPHRRNKHLCADAGYTAAPALKIIEEHGYIPHVKGRGHETNELKNDPRRKPGAGWLRWHTVGSTDFASCWCDTRSLIAASWL